MKNWLLALLLRYRRQRVIDDMDHVAGVIDVGRRRIAKLEAENRWRVKEAERIGRRIQALERPQALIAQSLRNRTA